LYLHVLILKKCGRSDVRDGSRYQAARITFDHGHFF
jgi:hypothetical protein